MPGEKSTRFLRALDRADAVGQHVERFVHRAGAAHHLVRIDVAEDRRVLAVGRFGEDAAAEAGGLVERLAQLRLVVREVAVDLEADVVAGDGHHVGRLHLFVEERLHRLTRLRELVEERGDLARLVEEEDEVARIADALDLERRLLFTLGEERAVGDVIDGVDGLLHAVLFDHEVIGGEAEDVIAFAIGDDDVEQDRVDVDLLGRRRHVQRHGFLREGWKGQRQKRHDGEETVHGIGAPMALATGVTRVRFRVHNFVCLGGRIGNEPTGCAVRLTARIESPRIRASCPRSRRGESANRGIAQPGRAHGSGP
jgi:hypothetical protein